MSNTPQAPISRWVTDLSSPDKKVRDRAVRGLYDQYAQDLYALASKRLGSAARRAGDETRVIIDSALRSFLMEPWTGVDDRDALRAALLTLVVRKASHANRMATASKRGAAPTGSLDARVDEDGELRNAKRISTDDHVAAKRSYTVDDLTRLPSNHLTADHVIELLKRGATPGEVDILIDTLDGLDEESYVIVAEFLRGQSIEQIAARLGVHPRTVKRALNEQFDNWTRAGEGDPTQ